MPQKLCSPLGVGMGPSKELTLSEKNYCARAKHFNCNQSATCPKIRDDLSCRYAVLFRRNPSVEQVNF